MFLTLFWAPDIILIGENRFQEAGKKGRVDMGRLEGKVAVITGTSSGYGRTMARMFAQEGAKIACLDITTKVGVGFEEDDDYQDPTHIAVQKLGGEAVFYAVIYPDFTMFLQLFREVLKKLRFFENNA